MGYVTRLYFYLLTTSLKATRGVEKQFTHTHVNNYQAAASRSMVHWDKWQCLQKMRGSLKERSRWAQHKQHPQTPVWFLIVSSTQLVIETAVLLITYWSSLTYFSSVPAFLFIKLRGHNFSVRRVCASQNLAVMKVPLFLVACNISHIFLIL